MAWVAVLEEVGVEGVQPQIMQELPEQILCVDLVYLVWNLVEEAEVQVVVQGWVLCEWMKLLW